MIVLHVASCFDVVSEIRNKQNDQSNQLVVDEMPLFVFSFLVPSQRYECLSNLFDKDELVL